MKMNSAKSIRLILLLVMILMMGVAFWGTHRYYENKKTQQLQSFAKHIQAYKKIDEELYQSLPIYEDYINNEKKKNLRKHLLADHLDVARIRNAVAIRDASHLNDLLKEKKMSVLEQNFTTPWYFHNVKKEYRFLEPHSQKGLVELAQRFNQTIKARITKKYKQKADLNFEIKFAISSATRPESYQQSLRSKNSNAALVSSHSYGISVDIFYDDFYLYRPLAENDPAYEFASQSRSLIGFSIGRARRRQLRAMLAETLLELQAEKKLYVIWERNQRCYHITFL